jgi:hypothetical protein
MQCLDRTASVLIENHIPTKLPAYRIRSLDPFIRSQAMLCYGGEKKTRQSERYNETEDGEMQQKSEMQTPSIRDINITRTEIRTHVQPHTYLL